MRSPGTIHFNEGMPKSTSTGVCHQFRTLPRVMPCVHLSCVHLPCTQCSCCGKCPFTALILSLCCRIWLACFRRRPHTVDVQYHSIEETATRSTYHFHLQVPFAVLSVVPATSAVTPLSTATWGSSAEVRHCYQLNLFDVTWQQEQLPTLYRCAESPAECMRDDLTKDVIVLGLSLHIHVVHTQTSLSGWWVCTQALPTQALRTIYP